MKTIIAGSRTFWDAALLRQLMRGICATDWITEVFSGGAKGADTVGRLWAEQMDIPVTEFPAEWNKYNKTAGPMRNQLMASQADACIVIWDGKSRGAADMIKRAVDARLVLTVFTTRAIARQQSLPTEKTDNKDRELENTMERLSKLEDAHVSDLAEHVRAECLFDPDHTDAEIARDKLIDAMYEEIVELHKEVQTLKGKLSNKDR